MRQALRTSDYGGTITRQGQGIAESGAGQRSVQYGVVLTLPARVTKGAAQPDNITFAAISVELVYRRHASFVRGVLASLGMAASIDDALQDVFVVVHRRLREFDGRSSIRSWLYSIARRVASHYRRSLRRAFDRERIEHDVPDRGAGPLELAQQRETLAVVAALLQELGPEKQRLLVLADVEEHSVTEIAEMTGTCLSTTYTRLRRARHALQESGGWRQLVSLRGRQPSEVTACGS